MSEKAKKIKEAIQNGTYVCDVETTAEKIILLSDLDLF